MVKVGKYTSPTDPMGLKNHSLIFEKGFNMIIKSIAREVGFVWIMFETKKLGFAQNKTS